MHLQVASQPRSVRVAYEIVLMWERSQSPAELSTPGCNKAITNRGVAQATSVATTVEAQSLAPHHRSYAAPVTGEGNLQRAHRSQGSRTGELGPTSLKHGTGGRSSEEMAKYRDIVNVSLTRGSSDWPDLRALDLSLHAAHRLQPFNWNVSHDRDFSRQPSRRPSGTSRTPQQRHQPQEHIRK